MKALFVSAALLLPLAAFPAQPTSKQAASRRVAQKPKSSASLHFRQGMANFNAKAFQAAIGSFSLSEKDPSLANDSRYYIGVSHFELGDLDNAEPRLKSVAEGDNPTLASYAKYYLATIALKRKEFDAAEEGLKSLVDTPDLPNDIRRNSLDMLVSVAKERSYQQRMQKRFGASILLDVIQYDTNVLTQPGDLNLSTKRGGFGSGVSAGAWYYAGLQEDFESALSYNFSANFHYDESFTNYDVWGHILSSRNVFKGESEGRAYRFSITPGAGLMQAQTSGNRRVPPRPTILHTFFLQNQASFFVTRSDLLEAHLNFKYDNSRLPTSVGNNDSSGFGASFGGTYLRYLTQDQLRHVSAGLRGEFLNAKGIEQRQRKLTLTAEYGRDLPWEIQGRFRFAAYLNDYYSSVVERRDEQLKAGIEATKYLSAKLWITQSLEGSKNFSNVDLGRYDRFITTSTLGTFF